MGMAGSIIRSRAGRFPPDARTSMANAMTSSGLSMAPGTAAGPLVVSNANPRYFAVRSGNADQVVYLTGSHFNNNFQDGAGPGADAAATPEQLDYGGYLAFLKEHGHNFIRLWRWEHFKSQVAGGQFHMCMSPQPWPRSGPGAASDGKPKFDLSLFDPEYFSRLRERVSAAGNQGIYVSVMLFDGFGLHLSAPPDNVEGHPFRAANNVNGVGITSIVDYQVLPLDPRVLALEETYIRKVVDTIHDLPNVLYEVANESSGETADSVKMPDGSSIATPIGNSTQWQYWVIDLVQQYEAQMGYQQHPVGMTMQYPVADQRKVNDPLFNSRADWISPGFDEPATTAAQGAGPAPGRWLTDPPANVGDKVVLSDTDHYSPFKSDALWAWKSFLRGHNPILYDMGIMNGVNPPDRSSGTPSYESFESARYAMGDTKRYAQKMKLIEMVPHGELSSTGYALASPGNEYLLLQPSEPAETFTVELAAGSYAVEWYDLKTRETAAAEPVTVSRDGSKTFAVPLATVGAAVLYLKCVGQR
jgi:hypothetical protein